jgi:hypothetical protein
MNFAGISPDIFGNFELFAPQPTQDSELLKQLGFIPGLKEFLMLRQVHALEHATVWVLSEKKRVGFFKDSSTFEDNETLGGLSTEKGFYLYGQVQHLDLQRAVRLALQRLQKGEWRLALHPRCGTNMWVGMLVTTGMVFGAPLLLPGGPIAQLIGLGMATQLTPELGMLAQRYLTTAIPFNLELENISLTQDFWGRSAYFISVRWQSLQ